MNAKIRAQKSAQEPNSRKSADSSKKKGKGASRDRVSRRKSVWILLRLLLKQTINSAIGVIVFVVIAGYLLSIHLASKPVNLQFLSGYALDMANSAIAPKQVRIQGLRLFWIPGDSPSVTAERVELYDETGNLLLDVPEIVAGFHLESLLTGSVNLTKLSFSEANVNLLRETDGSFKLAFRPSTDRSLATEPTTSGRDDNAEYIFTRWLKKFLKTDPIPEPFTHFKNLSIRNANILYQDLLHKRNWNAKGERIALSIDEDSVDMLIRAHAAREDSNGEAAQISMLLGKPRSDEPGVMSMQFSNMAPREFAYQFEEINWLRYWNARVSGNIKAEIQNDGTPNWLEATMQSDSGSVVIEGKPIALSSVDLDFAYNADGDKLTINQLDISSQMLHGNFSGDFVLINGKNGANGESETSLAASGTLFGGRLSYRPANIDAPFFFDTARTDIEIEANPFSLKLNNTRLARNALLITAEGNFNKNMGKISFARKQSTPMEQLLIYWPRSAAPGGREWVEENISQADISDTQGFLQIDETGTIDDFAVNFSFDKATITPLAGLPPVTGAKGRGFVNLYKLETKAEAGEIIVGNKGKIDVSGSSFTSNDLNEEENTGQIKLVANGPVAAALTLINTKPLSLLQDSYIEPEQFAGDVSLTGELQIPLLKEVSLDDIDLDFRGQLNKLSYRPAENDKKLTAESLDFALNSRRFNSEGQVTYAGIPMQISWQEVFRPEKSQPATRISSQFSLDRKKLTDLGFAAGIIGQGQASVIGRLERQHEHPWHFSFESNLKGIALQSRELGWRKPAKSSGTLQAEGQISKDGSIEVSKLLAQSKGLKISGKVNLLPDYSLAIADFPQFVIGKSDISLTIRRQARQHFAMKINGSNLDVSALSQTNNSEQKITRNFDAELVLDRMDLTESLSLGSVKGKMQANAGLVDVNLTGVGRTGGETILIDYSQSAENQSHIELQSADAGNFLREIEIFPDMHGGDLSLNMKLSQGEATSGTINIQNFRIYKSPEVKEILISGNLKSLTDEAFSEELYFDKARIPFTYKQDTWKFVDGVAVGPALGLSFSGNYNEKREHLDVEGAISPLHFINGLLGEIPAIGSLFTGGEGQGVFGMTFHALGSPEDLQITVNPLSFLAIGPFRHLLLPRKENSESDQKNPPQEQK